MITYFIQIFGFLYIVYCFVDTFISIRKDKKLIEELDYYKRKNKELERELKDTRIERNVFRDFVDEFLSSSKDNDQIVEVDNE